MIIVLAVLGTAFVAAIAASSVAGLRPAAWGPRRAIVTWVAMDLLALATAVVGFFALPLLAAGLLIYPIGVGWVYAWLLISLAYQEDEPTQLSTMTTVAAGPLTIVYVLGTALWDATMSRS